MGVGGLSSFVVGLPYSEWLIQRTQRIAVVYLLGKNDRLLCVFIASETMCELCGKNTCRMRISVRGSPMMGYVAYLRTVSIGKPIMSFSDWVKRTKTISPE